MSLFAEARFPACNSPEERLARLRLARTSRVGPIHFQQLIQRYGSATRALEVLPQIAHRTGGSVRPLSPEDAESELRRGEALGARLIVLGEVTYPKWLAHIPASPPVLWVSGALSEVPERAVAIVGARNASAAGQKMARLLARELGEAGYLIVSGLARGIDTAAHEASLKTGTVAVLGGGIDDIYPPENLDLYHAIKAHGALISESPPGYTARATDFPRRNRLISGLSLGVVVVEAELRSGSLITARLAGEQGRQVFAVPGSPLDPRCRGTNGLLRDGAAFCETAADVIDSLMSQTEGLSETAYRPPRDTPEPIIIAEKPPEAALDDLRERLLHLIGLTPVSGDELLRLSRAPAYAAFAALGELEITGVITQTGNGLYVRA